MNTVGRLVIYGAGLALAFGGTFAIAAAVVPDATVAAWSQDDRGAHSDPATSTTAPPATTREEQEIDVSGLTIAQSGFMIGPIQTPAVPGETSTLSFQILDPAGAPVTAFETAHGKDLHLITVRTDGAGYRHVHPELDPATGTWSLPWTWEAAGSYRVYADFTTPDATTVTLSRMIDVAGTLEPQPPAGVSLRDNVDGFDVTITGELAAGSASDLTVEVTRDGDPVADLEPYLGAFGHLVALRQGDLAYLHVHAHGDEPQPGDLAGPGVSFTAEVPTTGLYLLYLGFQVDGQVHTAQFVLDAIPPSGSAGIPDAPAGGTDDDADHDGH
ncbi:heavy-metal-associated domain-containing protein [Agrococcus sp. Ld7]|uniref:heavy-metal-associated domain-containing protein n=1 Tax=Agrococcus sp. Ld7 TaxID=649148 RepID=UPI00386E0990